MRLKKWNQLPPDMQSNEVRKYYDILSRRKGSLISKRIFDVCTSLIMLIILSPVFVIISIAILLDSKGGVFFFQERVTAYGKHFKIMKFRTMVANAEKLGAQLTISKDKRVTKVGKVLRNYRLDELPQLINIIVGDMSFVGTRPEVPKYVKHYTPDMMATLLLPAGVTSKASILYKDEYKLLSGVSDIDKTYVERVLPGKLSYNLESIKHFSFWYDIKTMILTVFAVCRKERVNQHVTIQTQTSVMDFQYVER